MEFQYKVDTEEAKDFQLVDSSKVVGAPGTQGGKRFVPQAKRRANAARLRQLNARRNDQQNQGNTGRYGLHSQPQRTKWSGRYVMFFCLIIILFKRCNCRAYNIDIDIVDKYIIILPHPIFFNKPHKIINKIVEEEVVAVEGVEGEDAGADGVIVSIVRHPFPSVPIGVAWRRWICQNYPRVPLHFLHWWIIRHPSRPRIYFGVASLINIMINMIRYRFVPRHH